MKKSRYNLHAGPESLKPDTTSEEPEKKEIKDLLGLTNETKMFWGKTTVIALVIIIFNLMWFSGKIPLDKWFVAICNFLLISSLTSRYLAGNPDWNFNSKVFTASLVVILVVMGTAKLEKNRIGSTENVNIIQKGYNEFIDWCKDDDAEAGIPKDYVTYYPGQKKIVELSTNNSSDLYFNFSRGTNITWQIDYGEYEVHTRSGKIYKMGKVPEYFLEDFKIFAVTDVRMGLLFIS